MSLLLTFQKKVVFKHDILEFFLSVYYVQLLTVIEDVHRIQSSGKFPGVTDFDGSWLCSCTVLCARARCRMQPGEVRIHHHVLSLKQFLLLGSLFRGILATFTIWYLHFFSCHGRTKQCPKSLCLTTVVVCNNLRHLR